MTSSASFWDKAAPKYATSAISDMEGYRATLERTIAHLSPTDRVLELGCGTASTALELAGHVAHITATDISGAMVEIGRGKVAEAGVDNITLHTGVAGDPEVAEGAPFDAILALNLLHLLPNQTEALAQIHDMLKPGGVFISKTACLGERWFFKPLVSVMALFGKAPYVTHQRVAALRTAIAAAGFETLEETTQPGTPPRLYMVARRV
ncbi:class I SAM-dependent methyltransferase [Rhodobacteraceae bacterium N5(2021)]|uniref:Class I SAM-dependent methyltransferase n=1 Tax=Gymnodinialimonas phycosphaerae TaxID=2841589 RepID=A0A975YHB2_9RHOB|nr:class I SAM-dependent methyltransferase [Gymnodinialimonas phycosphaerae]